VFVFGGLGFDGGTGAPCVCVTLARVIVAVCVSTPCVCHTVFVSHLHAWLCGCKPCGCIVYVLLLCDV